MKKILALLLALCMIFALAACGETAAPAQEEAPAAEPAAEEPAAEPAAEEPAAEEPAAEPAAEEPAPEKKATEDTPLVVGYSPFNSKFSPFFSETAYDQDAMAMTQLGLLTSDRTGAIVQKGSQSRRHDW